MDPDRRKSIGRLLAGWTAGLTAAWPSLAQTLELSQAEASAGVKAALDRGADAAVSLLGRPDGFLGNPKVRIPLPAGLESAVKLLKMTGQSQRVDELVTAMNRAAEAAVPAARTLLKQAIQQMTVADAKQIISGGDTSVTDFFAAKTRAPLTERFLPIVTQQTERLALAQQYNAVAGQVAGYGLVRKEDANVQQYVTAQGARRTVSDDRRGGTQDPPGSGRHRQRDPQEGVWRLIGAGRPKPITAPLWGQRSGAAASVGASSV